MKRVVIQARERKRGEGVDFKTKRKEKIVIDRATVVDRPRGEN